MNCRSIILVLLILVHAICASAQEGTSKHVEKANAYYALRYYTKAIPEFQKHIRAHKDDRASIYLLADCLRRTGEYERAEEWYEEYFSTISANDTTRIWYADVLKTQGKYREAARQYRNLPATFKNKETCIAYCDSFSNTGYRFQDEYSVKNLARINSAHSDITPVKYKNGIVFSSNREEVMIKKKTSNSNIPLYNILFAEGKDSLNPDKVSNFSTRINTVHHECCASFTEDYSKIFFTRVIDKPYSNDPGSKNALKMYSATYENNNWSDWQTFIFNDTTRSYGHPSVEGNEELFFFSSDMEGGYGGADIYVCFNIDGKWTNPINLGPNVNSAYNELYPFYHSDGTLYFSSNRLEGMGGYDIYSAKENFDGEYDFVTNVGRPINSPQDDLSLYWTKNMDLGYFSSNRPGGQGQEDIYIIVKK
jgi:hypothetical protein